MLAWNGTETACFSSTPNRERDFAQRSAQQDQSRGDPSGRHRFPGDARDHGGGPSGRAARGSPDSGGCAGQHTKIEAPPIADLGVQRFLPGPRGPRTGRLFGLIPIGRLTPGPSASRSAGLYSGFRQQYLGHFMPARRTRVQTSSEAEPHPAAIDKKPAALHRQPAMGNALFYPNYGIAAQACERATARRHYHPATPHSAASASFSRQKRLCQPEPAA